MSNKYNEKLMSNKLKEVDIRNCACYFFDVIINTKNLHPNKIKIDEKSRKNALFYCIEYVTVKNVSYPKISSVNSGLYFCGD